MSLYSCSRPHVWTICASTASLRHTPDCFDLSILGGVFVFAYLCIWFICAFVYLCICVDNLRQHGVPEAKVGGCIIVTAKRKTSDCFDLSISAHICVFRLRPVCVFVLLFLNFMIRTDYQLDPFNSSLPQSILCNKTCVCVQLVEQQSGG